MKDIIDKVLSKLFHRQKHNRVFLGNCCDCNKKLYGDTDVPGWNTLESGISHDVPMVCSRCHKLQYTWNGFYKPRESEQSK
jgi:hypothetical protein